MPALASQIFPAFASIADRNQPVDLSPGPERSSRSGKGRKTALKFCSVSYNFSCSDATHQACTPIQNGITNETRSAEADRPTLGEKQRRVGRGLAEDFQWTC